MYNKEIETWEPCHACTEVINDTIAGYRDRPSADEDDFGEDAVVPDRNVDDYEENENV